MKILKTDYRYKLPLVSLLIQGIPHKFLIDTGAHRTLVSPKILPVLSDRQQKEVEHRPQVGVGGLEHAYELNVPFSFIGVRVDYITVSSSCELLNQAGLRISGIIGWDLLQKFESIEFRYKDKVIIFK